MNKADVSILIVEDEFITSEALSEDLQKQGYHIAGKAFSAEEALNILQQKKVNLAILDINIQGDRDGIYLANLLQRDYHIPFIFLTAFGDQFTRDRAIATAPFGYLLKPFNEVEVYAAVELALKNFELQKTATSKSPTVTVEDKIFVRDNHGFEAVKLSDIQYLQAGKNYIDVHLADKKHLVRGSLKDIMELLPDAHFVQIHKSYVVNIAHVSRFETAKVQISNSVHLPLGASYKEYFKRHFNTLM